MEWFRTLIGIAILLYFPILMYAQETVAVKDNVLVISRTVDTELSVEDIKGKIGDLEREISRLTAELNVLKSYLTEDETGLNKTLETVAPIAEK